MPPGTSETDALLLAESIRAFARSLSQIPIWYFVPEDAKQLSTTTKDALSNLNVTLVPLTTDVKIPQFPFIRKVLAAASAEIMARNKFDLLAWLDANTVVLQEPKEFLLPDCKSLGFRPVHHTLVGSRYEEPLDPFWTLIYRLCKVPEDRVFPMTTHVDETRIRPYFNAGLLVTRPQRQLLKFWRDSFLQIYQDPSLQEFYRKDERYMIFIHQAVLSGIILSTFRIDEIQELPSTYNYPLHLHMEDVSDHRPSCLEELVTFRHEDFYQDPEWMIKMPAKDPLKQWINKRLLR